jgi:hypothetical protein
MTDDLVKRLRDKNCCDATKCNCDEAADRIEQLEAALRKTHSVLFMSIDYRGYEGGPLSMPFASLAEREARAALGEKKDV